MKRAFLAFVFALAISPLAKGGVKWLYPQMDMEIMRVRQLQDDTRRMGMYAAHPGELPPLRDCAEFRRRCAESDPLPEGASGLISTRYVREEGRRYVKVCGGYHGGGAIRTAQTGWEGKTFDGSWHPVSAYDDASVPPHRERIPENRRFTGLVRTNDFYDVGEEMLAYVECDSTVAPSLFVGESIPEMRDHRPEAREYDATMDEVGDGHWRTRNALAFRYLMFEGSVVGVRVIPVGRNRPIRGSLETGDAKKDALWRIGVRTLARCSDDFLIDGIKRDRLPWGGDLTVSLLANAYTYGDAEISRRSLSVMDAYLGDVNGIVTYSMWTIISHDLYQLYFGDRAFLRDRWWRIKERIEDLVARCDEAGLVAKKLDWPFVDWADPQSITAVEMVWCGALDAAARLADRVGDTRATDYRTLAKRARQALDTRAYDSVRGLYRANLDGKPIFGRQANVFAVVFDVVDSARAQRIGGELARNELPPVGTPYVYGWELIALKRTGHTAAFFAGIERVFGAMRDAGATTFWEGFDPAATGDARYAFYGRPWGKSLCHVWSAWPAFIFVSEGLGMKPTSDAWKTWRMEPIPGAESFRATVPTPEGLCRVSGDSHKSSDKNP